LPVAILACAFFLHLLALGPAVRPAIAPAIESITRATARGDRHRGESGEVVSAAVEGMRGVVPSSPIRRAATTVPTPRPVSSGPDHRPDWVPSGSACAPSCPHNSPPSADGAITTVPSWAASSGCSVPPRRGARWRHSLGSKTRPASATPLAGAGAVATGYRCAWPGRSPSCTGEATVTDRRVAAGIGYRGRESAAVGARG